jgi:hypothetical protein
MDDVISGQPCFPAEVSDDDKQYVLDQELLKNIDGAYRP